MALFVTNTLETTGAQLAPLNRPPCQHAVLDYWQPQEQPVAARTIQQEVMVVGQGQRPAHVRGQKIDALVDYIKKVCILHIS